MMKKKNMKGGSGSRPRLGSTYKADLQKRIFAGLVDAVICGIISGLLFLFPGVGNFLGPIVGALFWLFRDCLPMGPDEKNSPGKKIAGLRVEKPGARIAYCSPEDSLKRNLPAGLCMLMTMIPLVGKFLGPLLLLAVTGAEIYFMVIDPEGLRFGDRFANTKVFD